VCYSVYILVLQNDDQPTDITYYIDTCIVLQPQSTPGPYGQGYNGPAVQTPSLFPTQQQQTAAKPFNSPTVPNFYPANSVAKPSIPQTFSSTVEPPNPFSPAAPVSAVSQPHGGFANPSQLSAQAVPGAPTQSGKFVVFYLYLWLI
jgi:hypothetical protein